jgi:hypothetical protein
VQKAVHVHIQVVNFDLLKRHVCLLIVLIKPGVEAWDPHAAAVGALLLWCGGYDPDCSGTQQIMIARIRKYTKRCAHTTRVVCSYTGCHTVSCCSTPGAPLDHCRYSNHKGCYGHVKATIKSKEFRVNSMY